MEALKEESPEVDFSKQLWKCPKCVEYVDNVLPVFLLTFRVMDETGETKFLLFDKLAMAVVNQTTAELVDNLDEIQDPDVLPMALGNICGKTSLQSEHREVQHHL
uniref:Replication factor A C-terminal domain-containing protein n=1 Tax=Noccaea caerulescens TaxID=107243 RepID=A0A1J3I0C2_NOCCA